MVKRASAKQIAWRKKFARLYGGGKSRRKSSKKPRVVKMARPRLAPKYKKAYRNYVRHRTNVIPVIDTLHGLYTIDGVMNGEGVNAVKNFMGGLSGRDQLGFDKGIASVETGIQKAIADPKGAIIRGLKNFAVGYIARKGAEFIGLPRSVKFIGKSRLQIR